MAEREDKRTIKDEMCRGLALSAYLVGNDIRHMESAARDILRFHHAEEVVHPSRVKFYVEHRDQFEQDLLKLGDPEISALLGRHHISHGEMLQPGQLRIALEVIKTYKDNLHIDYIEARDEDDGGEARAQLIQEGSRLEVARDVIEIILGDKEPILRLSEKNELKMNIKI